MLCLGSSCVASPSAMMLVCVQDAAIHLAWLVCTESLGQLVHPWGFAKSTLCERRTMETVSSLSWNGPLQII